MDKKIYDNYTSTSVDIGEEIDSTIDSTRKYLLENFQNLLPKKKDSRILDLACGWGNYIIAMKEIGFTNITGCDISKEQTEKARELGLDNIYCSDIISFLTGKEKEYDLIIAFDIFEHLSEDQIATLMPLIGKSLDSGGKLIVQVPNGTNFFSPFLHSDITHKRAFTEISLAQLFKISGVLSKFSFFEAWPIYTGKSSIIRALFWPVYSFLFRIYLICILGNGHKKFNIFSANIIGVAVKSYEN